MTTVTKTYRLTRQMVAQLNVESEKRDCTPADLVRQIIADHFQRKQFECKRPVITVFSPGCR